MRLALLTEPWPKGKNPRIDCPVCGEWWIPWAGSYLPCHGRCIFTEEEQDALYASPLTQLALTEKHGVTVSVIQSAIGTARRRKELQ